MTEKKRFVKYDGNTIIDLKLVKSWVISIGDIDELLRILNHDKNYVELAELRECKKQFTVKEMQNWDKRFKICKEDKTKVIDTFDAGEFWTVHSNEAYNLCIQLNDLYEENQRLKKENNQLKHGFRIWDENND